MHVLIYDNTFGGFLTAIYQAFSLKTMELSILAESEEPPSLFPSFFYPTERELAEKVARSIQKKLSFECFQTVYHAWLSHRQGIETALFRFLKLSFHYKQDISSMWQSQEVTDIQRAAQSVSHETHRMLGALRFQKIEDVYVADMHPDYDILPLLAPHFAERFGSSNFIIRDRHYQKALFYQSQTGEFSIFPMSQFTDLEDFSSPQNYERAWKAYYHAMCIQERKNKKRMQHFIPKKYWTYMTEKAGE